MSFFEEDGESRRRTPRPRRAAPSGGPPSDHQTLLVRRGVALGGGLLLLVLLLLLINSCRSNAKENGLKDYNREVASIARDSESQVSAPFFRLMSGQTAGSTDVQTGVASLRSEADDQLDRAERIDTPDEMAAAQRSLLIVMELRRDGLDFIARRVRAAVGDDGDAADEATTSIAGQMQSFLTSDVLYRARVQPLIKSALDEAEIGGQDIPGSKFLPDIAWLSPATVADRLGAGGSGGGSGSSRDEEPAPGLHGSGLESVSVGDTRLTPDGANRIPAAGGPPTFSVAFVNQGENDEEDVRVDVRVSGGGGQPIAGSDTIDSVARGATATASVRLPRAPPTGAAVTITVRVRPVPGEEKTDNNEQEYRALFTE
jgi:hypothetical protein